MSKIVNVRLPNAVGRNYNPQQFDQFVLKNEQAVLQLNSSYTPTVTENRDQAQTWFLGG